MNEGTTENSWSNFGAAQDRTHGPAHEVLTVGSSPNDEVTHDAKGNITFLPTNLLTPARTLFWDFDNQLTGVDTTGDSTPDVTYQYDALHRRVARVQGSADAVYVHAGNQVIAEYRLGGLPSVPQQRYVWGDYIDEPILKQSSGLGGSTLYYHHNQQYSTVALTNTSGEVVERYAYTAYGELLITDHAGTPRSLTAHANRYTYTGREWDDATKLYYFRARWYEPVLGRFVNREPLVYADGLSLYQAYFGMSYLDPSGQLIGLWDAICDAFNWCDEKAGQVNTFVWTGGTWVHPSCASGLEFAGAGFSGIGQGCVNLGTGVKGTGQEMYFMGHDLCADLVCSNRPEYWSQAGQAFASGNITLREYYCETGINYLTCGTKSQIDTWCAWQRGEILTDEASQRLGSTAFFQAIGARQCYQRGGIWNRPLQTLPRDVVTLCRGQVPRSGWQLSPRACEGLSRDPFLGPCLEHARTPYVCFESAWCNGRLFVSPSGSGRCAMPTAACEVITPGHTVFVSPGGIMQYKPRLFQFKTFRIRCQPRPSYMAPCPSCSDLLFLAPELCPVRPICPIYTLPELLPSPLPCVPGAFDAPR